MRLGVILMSVLLGVTGCKGKKHSASKVVNFKHGESVTISATSMNDTSIKWAAHAVGWETKKGFVLSMTVGARPTVVLEHFSDADKAPSEAEMESLVSKVQPSLSPDGQHLRVLWTSQKDNDELFHLLPKGSPFQVGSTASKDQDGSKLPSAEKLAFVALAHFAKSPEKYDVPGQRYFWEALEDAAPGTALEGPLLDLWPACARTWTVVPNITRNSRAVTAEWKPRLDAKLDKCLSADASDRDFMAAVSLCLFVEDSARLTAIEPRLISMWPADAKLQRKAMESFEQFPEKVRAAWMEKALGSHSKFGAEEQARIYKLMKKWTDCETFKGFGMAHLGIEQKRKDCPNWPLKRFPTDGEASKKLQTFLADGKRNEAIRLVRQTTGWEYGKSVDFVDARAQAK